MAMRTAATLTTGCAGARRDVVGTLTTSVPTRASDGRNPRYTAPMPIYEYRCSNDHRFEVLQRFSDEALSECEVCGAPAARVLYPAAIHFKGSGFYSTDYGRRKQKKDEGKSDGGES